MSILTLRRVSLHPWAWWVVVKRAIAGYTQDQSLETRRRVASITKTLDAFLDPDEAVVESPYVRLGRHELQDRETRNREILEADPIWGQFKADEVVGGKLLRGYRPIPRPDMRMEADFSKDDLSLLKKAIEAYAKRSDVLHDVDQAIIDTLDALDGAEEVVIDTEKAVS